MTPHALARKFRASAMTTLFASALLAAPLCPLAHAQANAPATAKPEAVLHPADLAKLLPPTVFFRGQSAPTQERNSGGVRFDDGGYVIAALVDTSGYSTGVQAKYQGYLLTEVALHIGDKTLPPGAYGFGFIADNKFNILDIGNHEVFTIDSEKDAELKRPTPLQVRAGAQNHRFRLYAGKSFITFFRAD